MLNSLNASLQSTASVGLFVLLLFIIHHIANSIDPIQETRCLNCIRNVSTLMGIDTTKRCEGYYCGQFQLSYTYWAEAGKPGNNQGSKDYEKCARDKSCSEQTVRAYFKKFKRDCNNDGLIDCLDMAALHKGGPTSCSSDWLYKTRFWLAFNKTDCMINRDLTWNHSRTSSAEFDSQSSINSLGLPVRTMKNQSLTPECLDCICDAVSGCNTSVNNCGSGPVCGPFAISQTYWRDGKGPGASWTACTRTKECSSVTMKNYMEKYKRDCNGDGYITCEDYAAIHRRGPRACSNKDLLKDHYWNKFLACRANQTPLKDVSTVKVNEGSDDSNNQNVLASRGDITSLPNPVPSASSSSEQGIVTNPVGEFSSSVNTPHVTQTPQQGSANSRFEFSQTPSYELTPLDAKQEEHTTPKSSSKRPIMQSYDTHHQLSLSTQGQNNQQEYNNKHKLDISPAKKPESSKDAYHPSMPTTSSNAHETSDQRKPADYEDVPIILVKQPSPTGWSTTSTQPSTGTFSQVDPVLAATTTSTPGESNKAMVTKQGHNHEKSAHVSGATSQEVSSQANKQSHDTHQPGPNFSPMTDHPIARPGPSEEIDFSVPDFPFSAQADRGSNSFDKVVIGIVGSPDFSKSYPPVPEIVEKKSDQPPAVTYEEYNHQLASKSQQKINTNHSRNPNHPQANKPALLQSQSVDPGRHPGVHHNNNSNNNNNISNNNGNDNNNTKKVVTGASNNSVNNQRTSSSTTVGVNNNQQQQHQPQPHQQQSQPQPLLDKVNVGDNNPPILAPIFGIDSINMSSLFEKASLNESSRISSECLECICDASSNCDTTVQCISKQREKNRCGLYMISWNQYQESDISLTSLISPQMGVSEMSADEKMYYDCTTDRACAEKLIHLYIEKHQKDCNNDGKIDCYDIAAIHRVGPESCNSGKFLSSQYWKDFNICYTTDRLTTTVRPQVSSQLLRR